MKTAIVHEWLVSYAGSEKVTEQIYGLYPSEIYTMVHKKEVFNDTLLKDAKVFTSALQKYPFKLGLNHHRLFLPFMPYLVEQYDLSSYDVVLSCSHAVAKGVITRHDQLHINYSCSPIRYAWDLYYQYLNESGLTSGLKALMAKIILHYIRMWDYATCYRPDYIITLSNYIARRIKKIYGRESTVIYPPVDVENFKFSDKKEDFYLAASRMVPYKKMDMIVEAFSKMPDKKLVVIGDGPDFDKAKSKASKNVELLGYQPFEKLRDCMQRAKAFIFAAEEDFGIVPIEAQACGTPVIAFGRGGVTETILNGKTGLFFDEQTPESLIKTINKFEQDFYKNFDPKEARKQSEFFSIERFRREYKEFVDSKMNEKFN